MIEVWPSSLALLERQFELGKNYFGSSVHFNSKLFTFEGRYNLLSALTRNFNYLGSRLFLSNIAGPFLIYRLLKNNFQNEPLFNNLITTRRLPYDIWQIILQIKAVGLTGTDLKIIAEKNRYSLRLFALGRLMIDYQNELDRHRLIDESDLLFELEKSILNNCIPVIMQGWKNLIVKRVIWLKPLEIKLLKILSSKISITIEFPLFKEDSIFYDFYNFLKKIENHLKFRTKGKIKIIWIDLTKDKKFPLSNIIQIMNSETILDFRLWKQIKLWRAPNSYTEVEALILKAKEIVEKWNIAPHLVAVIFSNLDSYFQKIKEIAYRIKLPISYYRNEPLIFTPLVHAFLTLLELPLSEFARYKLAKVWESPYIGPALANIIEKLFFCKNFQNIIYPIISNAGLLLIKINYIDSREIPVWAWLEMMSRRYKEKVYISSLKILGQSCRWLFARLAPLKYSQSLATYINFIIKLLSELKIENYLKYSFKKIKKISSWLSPGLIYYRDLKVLFNLIQVLGELEFIGSSVLPEEIFSSDFLLDILKDVLKVQTLFSLIDASANNGVAILDLEEAQGVSFHTILIGGLVQNCFLQKFRYKFFSYQESLALNKKVGLPVLRTEKEEYNSRILLFFWVLSLTQKNIFLSYPVVDIKGKKTIPFYIFRRINFCRKKAIGKDITMLANKFYYSNKFSLNKVYGINNLLANLHLIAVGGYKNIDVKFTKLANAVLWRTLQELGSVQRWYSIIDRAEIEEARIVRNINDNKTYLNTKDKKDRYFFQANFLVHLNNILTQDKYYKFSSRSLETYTNCPQAWFFNYLLKLKKIEFLDWGIKNTLEGIWVHKILAYFFNPKKYSLSWNAKDVADQLIYYIDITWKELNKKSYLNYSLIIQARQSILLQLLSKVIEIECQFLKNNSLRPLAVEKSVNLLINIKKEINEELSFNIKKHFPILLTGRLDRLDGNGKVIRVIDYKHIYNQYILHNFLKREEWGRKVFQLPVYLLAARRIMENLSLIIEGRLISTKRNWRKIDIFSLFSNDSFLIEDQNKRLILAKKGAINFLNAIELLWKRLTKGELIIVRPDQERCIYCIYNFICRIRIMNLTRNINDNEDRYVRPF